MAEFIYERPPLYPKQRDAVFNDARYAVVEASTKSGKTYACIAWLFEQAIQGRPGQHFWWVAPVSVQARIAFDRLSRGLPIAGVTLHRSDLSIHLPNGATIWFKSAERPDSLYGEDVHAAVIDEATRMREEAWHAVRSTLTSTRGPVRIIGNVKGRKNWAYRFARRAEGGDPEVHYARITALDAVEAGLFEADEIDDARRHLPEGIFRELFFAEPSDDGGNPFGIEAIRAGIGALSANDPVAWGWDLGRAQDWTVGMALDRSGQVCRFIRFQAPWNEIERRIVAETGHVNALVDSTGVGDVILDRLRDQGHFEGFHFTSQSKQQLMEGLAVAIQQRELCFPDGEIVSELTAFEYEYTRLGVKYTAPAGMHDDCVDALALSVHAFRNHRSHEIPDAPLPSQSLSRAELEDLRDSPGYWPSASEY